MFTKIIDLRDRITEAGSTLRSWIPFQRGYRRPRFNFITLHYIYLIGLTIIGSILLYPAGELTYINALFFSAGCSTQSGLNPVDINKLHLYQQIVMFFMAMIANPIFINSFVVFVRLYWFEKRFQNIVKDARNLRRTRTRSRTKTEGIDDGELERAERGVNGRPIVVLHDTSRMNSRVTNGHMNGDTDGMKEEEEDGDKVGGSDTSNGASGVTLEDEEKSSNGPPSPKHEPTASFRRDIMFADELPRRDGEDGVEMVRLPERATTEQNIAFLEKQRNQDKGALRIPGPRDFDRGHVPETVNDDEDGGPLGLAHSKQSTQRVDPGDNFELNEDDHPAKRAITIDEPDHPRQRKRTNTFASFGLRRRRTDGAKDEDEPSGLRNRGRTATFSSFMTSRSQDRDPMPYLSWQPTIGRNSAFIDLTEEQRDELGGIEYRALKTLAFILVVYFIGFHLLGVVCLLPWIVRSERYGAVVDAVSQNKVWWGFFTPASMFNDLGFTLTPDSMMSFATAVFPLLLGSFLIIIGNTGFPCMLRFVIWLSSKLVPQDSSVWEELQFLLDHPRRCFTLLFPSKATWWLFWILCILNGLDLIFFIILDLNDPAVTQYAAGTRVLDGWFQAASTRTAGFSVVNLAALHPGIQVSYLIMMYISAFPVAISMRRTNVYEEKSLGIYGSKEEEEDEEALEPSYVGAHLRRQLSFDLWYIFLGLFIIAIAEGSRLSNTNEYQFTLFSCLFEIVSAYGTVGLSLGYPNIDASFSAEFNVISKLVIIAMQIRGRHRGLPYALDRAILLPSESLHKTEDNLKRTPTQRRTSTFSQVGPANTTERPDQAATSGYARSSMLPTRSQDLRSSPPPSSHDDSAPSPHITFSPGQAPVGGGPTSPTSPLGPTSASTFGSWSFNHPEGGGGGGVPTSPTPAPRASSRGRSRTRTRSVGASILSGFHAGPSISRSELGNIY
ncbi:potassium transport protein TRK1/TRK2 [Xylona heveae TC161]|uniref:Potassium transport protein n=1 Tax=Xylona heveae (strain CBS 132557 / TC161) TaxID=1328760 RepID=A0A165AB66_XYLHT|nr:potassium transport protein TRK1/TRK2 [Xylona heveae TC161]KZF20199.1 potassium transport protein TRK1/TRK2 [Xylona heveae TC161]